MKSIFKKVSLLICIVVIVLTTSFVLCAADDDYTIKIYEGSTTDEALAFNETNILPGDTYSKEYTVEVNYIGEIPLNFCFLKDDLNGVINAFNVKVEYYIEPESTYASLFEGTLVNLINLSSNKTEVNNLTNNVSVNLNANEAKTDRVHYRITFEVPTNIDDNYSDSTYATYQEQGVQFDSFWWTDVEEEEEPDPHHDPEPHPHHDDDPGHVVPETGIFGLRYTKKQETVFFFFLALLLLLIIVMYKYFKKHYDQRKSS